VSQQDVTHRDALVRLGTSTGEAIEQVLEMLAPGRVKRGEVSVLSEKESPFAKLAPGTVASSVSYVDGVTGGNIFVLPAGGARKLAEAMGLPPSEGEADAAVSELELSAVAEAANQMMAAAANAIGTVLGHEIEISPPDTKVIEDPARAADRFGTAPHATSTTFVVAGESCRLIQLVPSAFVVRMVRAIDELAAAGPTDSSGAGAGAAADGLRAALGETKLRVWAELGRTRMPLGQALTLPLGGVVDLDDAADAPVKLFVNGVAFAHGHLIVRDGEWAMCIDEVLSGGPASATAAPQPAAEPQPYEFPQAQASTEPAESTESTQLEGALT
jgi:flagellar motor switch protein FliN/FliY